MALSGNQRFGLITFFALIIAAYLVTTEPWKKLQENAGASFTEAPPVPIRLGWESISDGYPLASTTDTIRIYAGFDLGYNEANEQAAWVAYVLSADEILSGKVDRTDDFRPDTAIATGSAFLDDYRGSGFDRGHLAPAGDMKWSLAAMSESFFLSNMSPQRPAFNRGIWRRLEERVRDWALEMDSLYVITGPVLSSVDSSIGQSRVGVPPYYFKVLVDLSPPGHSMIAFLLPHEGSSADILDFALTVDSLEQFTGYDFFAGAPDTLAVEWLESRILTEDWK